MSVLVLAAIVFNIFLALSVAILWIRTLRPAKEDPRLSRGLQLLQSKIAVLEDLSDRTETQVKQLTQILDERAINLQTKMLQAQETILKIEQSMHKSLDVAEIFQDKIPHEEIIERNQQSKYVHAAQLAHQGQTVEQIAQQIDLPRNEIEFITKVNRDELTFNPELLPEWAKPKTSQAAGIEAQMVDRVFHTPSKDLSSLHKIEADFKRTVNEVKETERLELERQQQAEARVQALKQQAAYVTQQVSHQASQMTQQVSRHASQLTHDLVNSASQILRGTAAAAPTVRKVQFPRITK